MNVIAFYIYPNLKLTIIITKVAKKLKISYFFNEYSNKRDYFHTRNFTGFFYHFSKFKVFFFA